MKELTRTQMDILEKLPENIRDETISLIVKSQERFNKRLEIYSKVMKLCKEGLGDRKITRLTGISRNVIDSWIYREVKPRYRLILPDATCVIKKLKESGLTTVEIGNLLSISSARIGRIISSKKIEDNKEKFLSKSTIDFINTYENPLEFLNYMWLVKINQKSLDSARAFCEFIKLKNKMGFFELCRKLKKSYPTLSNWKKGKHVPWLINWLELYLKLGRPRDGYVWLPLSLDFRINPSHVIEVPTKIEKWEDIEKVIEKLTSIEGTELSNTSKISKKECFGFILGMMVGDAGKSIRRDRLDLQLTTRSRTNLKLGTFFCDCIKKLGLKAYRTKNTRWFYRWVSQVSPFFNWTYKVVLGLEEKETTTYDPVKADWLLNAPQEIVRRFLQGIYESDGSVSFNKQITCVTFPNAFLIQKLLKRFDIKSYIGKDKYKRIKIYSLENLKKAHELLFAPEIKTERFQRLKTIVESNQRNYKRVSKSI